MHCACRSAMEMDEAARLEEELANIKKERDDLETKRASCTRRPLRVNPKPQLRSRTLSWS